MDKIFESIYEKANHLRELTAEKGLHGHEITGNPDDDFESVYLFYVDGNLQKGSYVKSEAKKKYAELKKEFPNSTITYTSRKPSQL
jgi:hypothetical protein